MSTQSEQGGAGATPQAPGTAEEACCASPSSRRGFLRDIALRGARIATGAGVLGGFIGLRGSRSPLAGMREDLGLLRPPGSLDEEEFLASCIRCTRCSDACETGCIKLFGPEGGNLEGTPYIVPAEAGCNLCLACGKACPSESIQALEDKTQAHMGVAVVDERLCVSHNGSGVCGACHTVCPLRNRAITQNFRNAPVVDPEQCTGCGLCEELCIVRDRKAIRVVSRRSARGGKPPGE